MTESKEKRQATNRRYYLKHREQIQAYQKQYHAEHSEKLKEYHRNYYRNLTDEQRAEWNRKARVRWAKNRLKMADQRRDRAIRKALEEQNWPDVDTSLTLPCNGKCLECSLDICLLDLKDGTRVET